MANYPPVIYTYLKKFQEDPSSRVFAPLAEAYRKAGMVEEAVSIAREGLQVHPGFIGGRVALARALFDQQKYTEVVEEIKKFINDVPDNLIAQRLLAESSLLLGNHVDALAAYKMLLYFHPGDVEIAQIVRELETQAYGDGQLVLRTDVDQAQDTAGQFSVQGVHGAIDQDPDAQRATWVQRVEKLQNMLQSVERYRSGPAS